MPSRRRALQALSAVAVPGIVLGRNRAAETDPSPDARPDDDEDVEWRTTFGDGDYQLWRVRADDDGVVLLGRTGRDRSAAPWLAAVGPDGEARWTTTIDLSGFADASGVAQTDDGYAVLGTTDVDPPLRLIGLDERGRERWRRDLDPPFDAEDDAGRLSSRGGAPLYGYAFRATDDGYLLAGASGDPRRSDHGAWVRAVDADGATRWERTYDANRVTAVLTRSDGFVLAGDAGEDAWLQSIGSDGDPAWRHTYGSVEEETLRDVAPAGDGVVYAGATGAAEDAHWRAMLVRATAEGAFAWRRTYEGLHRVAGLVPLDEGYAITGEPSAPDRTGRNPEKPVHVVDEWGRVQRTASVSVPVGEPVGLRRFDDGSLAVAGWSSEDGNWIAKITVG